MVGFRPWHLVVFLMVMVVLMFLGGLIGAALWSAGRRHKEP
jgi:hypothetical protein